MSNYLVKKTRKCFFLLQNTVDGVSGQLTQTDLKKWITESGIFVRNPTSADIRAACPIKKASFSDFTCRWWWIMFEIVHIAMFLSNASERNDLTVRNVTAFKPASGCR